MDFLLENDGKPVPADLGSVAEQKPPAGTGTGDMDEDDEDLRAALGLSKAQPGAEGGEGSSGNAGGGVAQVGRFGDPNDNTAF